MVCGDQPVAFQAQGQGGAGAAEQGVQGGRVAAHFGGDLGDRAASQHDVFERVARW